MIDPQGSNGRPSILDPASRTPPAEKAKQLDELRNLIIDGDFRKLVELQKRMEDPAQYARDLSKVLPRAVFLSANRSDQLGRALAPTVEEAIRASVRKDPHHLVDAIFPVMGPAIRKAAGDAVGSIVESVNASVANLLSFRGLRWFIEAKRTGRTYAEVALAHTVQFRVEQVFLIHRETGLLLMHVMAAEVAGQDPDMISGMLTAIQDFVKDSFKTEKGEGLDEFKVGQLKIWVERGPRAVIAAAVRGNAPPEVRTMLAETVENVHMGFGDALASFTGDIAPFEGTRRYLESCLIQQERESRRNKFAFPFFWIVFIALLALLGWYIYERIALQRRWEQFVTTVDRQEGIVVTDYGRRRNGDFYLSGLRDPSAEEPKALIDQFQLSGEIVRTDWGIYLDHSPAFVLARARALLRPPPKVVLRLEDGRLIAEGPASTEWIERARILAPTVNGVRVYDDSGVYDIIATEINSLLREMESMQPRFVFNTSTPIPEDEFKLEEMAARARVIYDYARQAGYDVRLHIIGHTDSTGTAKRNAELSLERANVLRAAIVAAGVDPATVTTEGAGPNQPLREEKTEEDRLANRRAQMRVTLVPRESDHVSSGPPARTPEVAPR